MRRGRTARGHEEHHHRGDELEDEVTERIREVTQVGEHGGHHRDGQHGGDEQGGGAAFARQEPRKGGEGEERGRERTGEGGGEDERDGQGPAPPRARPQHAPTRAPRP